MQCEADLVRRRGGLGQSVQRTWQVRGGLDCEHRLARTPPRPTTHPTKSTNRVLQTCKDTCTNLDVSIDIFDDPEGWQRRMWDIFIVILVLMLMVTVPFEACVTWWHPEDSYYGERG